MTRRAWTSALAGLGLFLAGSTAGQEPVSPEELSVKTLGAPETDWVWINDIAFNHMPDGRAYLVDAGEGEFLGMLSAGYGHGMLQLAPDGSAIYNPETYYARGTRGERTDVLTIYDPAELAPEGEIEIPPKRFQGMPSLGTAALTDDGRFSLVYNFTPAQSVTVVDLKARELVGEIDSGGCSLVFPTGPRGFFSLCGDGGLLEITLEDSGEAADRSRIDPFFDPQTDPLIEKPVRVGDTWYFVSFQNKVYPVRVGGDGVRVGEPWSLTSRKQFEKKNWRIGGIQLLAAHRPSKRLYALMHRGGSDTHKNPGTEVWVYDLDSRQRVARLKLKRPATAIAVSQGSDPLLYTVLAGDRSLHVHDAETGERLRKIGELGTTMTTIQTPPVPEERAGEEGP